MTWRVGYIKDVEVCMQCDVILDNEQAWPSKTGSCNVLQDRAAVFGTDC